MLRFLIRRLLQVIPTLLLLSVAVFAWLRALPGGPAGALLGDKATPEKIASLNRVLGLDRPIWEQYLRFLGRVATGDFGSSLITGEPVTTEIGRALPATIELTGMALFIAIVLGIPLGYLAATRRGTALDSATIVATLVGVAVPVFFLGYLLKSWFAVKLGWLPPSGRASVGLDATRVTGFAVLDGLLTREFDASLDAMKHLILPAVTVATIPLAVIVRITRASVLDVLGADFIRTARAKGLAPGTVRGRHVLRNALLPVSTTIGLQTGLLLVGAVLTEKVFVWGGVGTLLADGIYRHDYPRLQALLMLGALLYLLVNLLVDLSYAIIDPRVRLS
ncbi:ABC transporter permease [Pseudonocardia eucalypti]|uniref:ABC transporter permease n=1 Tax=Pseudonocardia eucalypti TaxID=648755 RepID=A0ABP9PDA2_9PSEU|nr:peptide/nickel transport system permease protein [Pseudonocardia eucalypti]